MYKTGSSSTWFTQNTDKKNQYQEEQQLIERVPRKSWCVALLNGVERSVYGCLSTTAMSQINDELVPCFCCRPLPFQCQNEYVRKILQNSFPVFFLFLFLNFLKKIFHWIEQLQFLSFHSKISNFSK